MTAAPANDAVPDAYSPVTPSIRSRSRSAWPFVPRVLLDHVQVDPPNRAWRPGVAERAVQVSVGGGRADVGDRLVVRREDGRDVSRRDVAEVAFGVLVAVVRAPVPAPRSGRHPTQEPPPLHVREVTDQAEQGHIRRLARAAAKLLVIQPGALAAKGCPVVVEPLLEHDALAGGPLRLSPGRPRIGHRAPFLNRAEPGSRVSCARGRASTALAGVDSIARAGGEQRRPVGRRVQEMRRRIRQQQTPVRMTARARKIAVSYHWKAQNLLAGGK